MWKNKKCNGTYYSYTRNKKDVLYKACNVFGDKYINLITKDYL